MQKIHGSSYAFAAIRADGQDRGLGVGELAMVERLPFPMWEDEMWKN